MVISQLSVKYLSWASGYYRKPSGRATREAVNVEHSLRPFVRLFGSQHLDVIGVEHVEYVRQSMIVAGLSRTTVNGRMCRIRRFVRWCIRHHAIAASALLPWQVVEPLKYARSTARETGPVAPVDVAAVEATLRHVHDVIARMVRLQLATGMRSGELCGLRWECIDVRGDTWTYRPLEHKTEHHGHQRFIPIRPAYQQLLGPVQQVGVVFVTRRGRPWTPGTYRQAVMAGTRRAGVGHWTPLQLRHNAAIHWADTADFESARLLLGHASARETTRYLNSEPSRVLAAARKVI